MNFNHLIPLDEFESAHPDIPVAPESIVEWNRIQYILVEESDDD